MKAVFGINREKDNHLIYREYVNSKGVFHFHSQIELCIVKEGELDVVVNSQRKRLKQGEMSVALSFDAHSYHTLNHSKAGFMFIPLYMCDEFRIATEDKRVINPFIYDKNIVRKIVDCISEIEKEDTSEIKRKGYVYVILGMVMENICFEQKQTSTDAKLSSELLFYINEHFKDDISLSAIATTFGYNQTYISRYFKDSFSIGINQYINMIRLRNALLLMHENQHNITYCAMESGFNSMRTFYRAFYNEFRCSPKEYLAKKDG